MTESNIFLRVTIVIDCSDGLTNFRLAGSLIAWWCSRSQFPMEEGVQYILPSNGGALIKFCIKKSQPNYIGMISLPETKLEISSEIVHTHDTFHLTPTLPLQIPLFIEKLPIRLLAAIVDDNACDIFVSLNTMTSLGCENGSYVTISTEKESRTVQVFLSDLPSLLIDGICLLPSLVYLSLFKEVSLVNSVLVVKNDITPHHASRVILRRLPICDHQVSCSNNDAAIEEYFRIPRLLKSGDVLRIISKEIYLAQEVSMMSFYQITICGDSNHNIQGMIVDSAHTTLLEEPLGSSCHYDSVCQYFKEFEKNRNTKEYLIFGNEEIYSLVQSALTLPRMTLFRLVGPRGSGKHSLVKYFHSTVPVMSVNIHDLYDEVPLVIEKKLASLVHKIATHKEVLFYRKVICHVRHVGSIQDHLLYKTFYEPLSHRVFTLVIIESTTHATATSSYAHRIDMPLPDETTRQKLLANAFTQSRVESTDFHMMLDTMVKQTTSCNRRQLYELSDSLQSNMNQDPLKTLSQFMDKKELQRQFGKDSQALTPHVPIVEWSQIGGLESAKSLLEETLEWPVKFPALFKGTRHRSGVLLHGPPGTGKTMLAKAVATSCQRPFLAVKGPELMNMYVGESERHVRMLFDQARACRPCIIFFDELDALAPQRGAAGDSGGVMDRVVSQILTEMDDLGEDIMVIGATNRPDLIDSALLRAGRFEIKIYVGPSDTVDEHVRLFMAQTKEMALEVEEDQRKGMLREIASQCPKYMTGADVYAITSNALLIATKRTLKQAKINYQRQRQNSGLSFDEFSSQLKIIVMKCDFADAMKRFRPSIHANGVVLES